MTLLGTLPVAIFNLEAVRSYFGNIFEQMSGLAVIVALLGCEFWPWSFVNRKRGTHTSDGFSCILNSLYTICLMEYVKCELDVLCDFHVCTVLVAILKNACKLTSVNFVDRDCYPKSKCSQGIRSITFILRLSLYAVDRHKRFVKRSLNTFN